MEHLSFVTIAAAAIGLVLGLSIVFFLRAMESRKRYRCHECGEQVQVELMNASRCNSCGTPFEQQAGA